jgi:hypothetical protein
MIRFHRSKVCYISKLLKSYKAKKDKVLTVIDCDSKEDKFSKSYSALAFR